MKIYITSVFVDDQSRARDFYTRVLGFKIKHDIPMGTDSWITLTAPGEPDGPELLLEPSSHPAVLPFKQALVADEIPFTSFAVQDVQAEYRRLRGLGVQFTQEPTDMGPVTTAVFDDTCGNLIQLSSYAG